MCMSSLIMLIKAHIMMVPYNGKENVDDQIHSFDKINFDRLLSLLLLNKWLVKVRQI